MFDTTSYKFSVQYRIRQKHCFDKVMQQADYRLNAHEILVLAKRNHLLHARIGFIVSKKVLKTAVSRNRFKRVIRETFRIQNALLPAVDIVVLLRRKLPTPLEKITLAQTINRQWIKLAQLYPA